MFMYGRKEAYRSVGNQSHSWFFKEDWSSSVPGLLHPAHAKSVRAIEERQNQLGLIKIDVSFYPLCEYWKFKQDLGKAFPSSKVGVLLHFLP